MAHAAEARTSAPGALRGMIDSLYTPFMVPGGEEIDETRCVPSWPTVWALLTMTGSGSAGLSANTGPSPTAERKRLLEVAVEETRAIKPEALIEACPASTNVLETVELARHAATTGATSAS